MKELEETKTRKIEVQAQKQEIKKLKFLGSLRPHKGQECYQLEVATGVVTLAEFTTTNVPFGSTFKVSNKIIVKPGYLYNTAINKKNAQRKFIKMLIKYLQNKG